MNNIAGVTTGCRLSDVGNSTLTNRKYNICSEKKRKVKWQLFTTKTKHSGCQSTMLAATTVFMFLKITFN